MIKKLSSYIDLFLNTFSLKDRKDTVETLLKHGIPNGAFQNYVCLSHLLAILDEMEK